MGIDCGLGTTAGFDATARTGVTVGGMAAVFACAAEESGDVFAAERAPVTAEALAPPPAELPAAEASTTRAGLEPLLEAPALAMAAGARSAACVSAAGLAGACTAGGGGALGGGTSGGGAPVLGAALEGADVAESPPIVTTRGIDAAAESGVGGAVTTPEAEPAGERADEPAGDGAGVTVADAVRGAAGSGREVRTI